MGFIGAMILMGSWVIGFHIKDGFDEVAKAIKELRDDKSAEIIKRNNKPVIQIKEE